MFFILLHFWVGEGDWILVVKEPAPAGFLTTRDSSLLSTNKDESMVDKEPASG